MAAYAGRKYPLGTVIVLSSQKRERDQLVLSQDGNLLAYVIPVPTKDTSGKIVKDAGNHDFRQIFIMSLDWEVINNHLKNSYQP